METLRDALIHTLSEIILPDTGSRKVQQCADAVIAVCDAYPRTATLLTGGTVVVNGRTSAAQDFKAALNLPDGYMIVRGGVDMAKPESEVQAELFVEPSPPEVHFPETAPRSLGEMFKKIFS